MRKFLLQWQWASNSKLAMLIGIAIASLTIPGTNCLDFEYMESNCGATSTFESSFHMDASTGITYRNLLDCTYTVTAPSNHFVLAVVTRFELEAALTGTCTDYLRVYDGTGASASELTTGALCGSGSSIPANFTSSGQSMTLHFVTDNIGVYLGFNMIFVAVQNAPCTDGDFLCNTSICIDPELACDGYNQCGDSSDEDNCLTASSSDGIDIVMIVVIVVSVTIAIALLVAYIVYRVYEKNKWKKFLNEQGKEDFNDMIVEPGPSYPITNKYYRGIRGHVAYDNSGKAATLEVQETAKPNLDTPDSQLSPSTSSAAM